MKYLLHIGLVFLLAFLLSSCSVNKLLPAGEKLYSGASLELERANTSMAPNLQFDLESVIIPKPNTTLFGFPWKAWFNLKFQTNKEKGFKHWLSNTIGEPPVLYDSLQVQQVEDLLENRGQNLGYFQTKATSEVQELGKKASVKYTLKLGPAYQIDTMTIQIQDTALEARIRTLEAESIINNGQFFSLNNLKQERQRIESALREQGYYFFKANDIEFFADTLNLQPAHHVELLLKLKSDIPAQSIRLQKIKAVNVYQNYQLNARNQAKQDSTSLKGISFYCNDCPLKNNALVAAFAVEPGMIYQPSKHRKTLERLSNLNTFKYINLNYEQAPGSDSLLILNAYLSPRARRTIEGEVGAAYNTGRYFGPEIALKYTNRNLFRGAEFLTLDSRYTYNTFLGPQEEAVIPSWTKLSFGATLSIPRFWLPNRERLSKNLQYANTRIQLSLDNESLGFRLANLSDKINELELTSLQQKLAVDSTFTPPVKLTNYQLKYGYNWQKVPTIKQEVNPFVIRLQTVGVDDSELLDLFRDFNVGEQSSLVRLEQMQLYSPDYVFSFDSRLGQIRKRNLFYRQRVAFNVNRVVPLGNDIQANSETSLFLQWETDLHYYLNLSKGKQIASRLRIYTGYPLSKEATIPYFDLYTVGGSNSLRAFPPRGVGPGTIDPSRQGEFSIFTGYGNILLEANIEYRRRFGSYIELAPFLDAGNVWQYRTQARAPNAEFALKNIFKELAIDTGIGFRYDLGFLIIRTDFAWPITQPWLPEGERLVINQFFQNGWWWDNLNFVLAFGYPF